MQKCSALWPRRESSAWSRAPWGLSAVSELTDRREPYTMTDRASRGMLPSRVPGTVAIRSQVVNTTLKLTPTLFYNLINTYTYKVSCHATLNVSHYLIVSVSWTVLEEEMACFRTLIKRVGRDGVDRQTESSTAIIETVASTAADDDETTTTCHVPH